LRRWGLGRKLQRRLFEQAYGRNEKDTLMVLVFSDVTKKDAEEPKHNNGGQGRAS